MATRKRIFYQSENLHVAPSGIPGAASDITQIHRVQNINYSFELTRTDVNQFGQLAAIDRVILEQPTVSLDFSYYPTTGEQESGIGLKLNTPSCIASILDGASDIKSYYILTAPEGKDGNSDQSNADGYAGTTDGTVGVIGVGNAFLTSYSAEGSVGEFLSASINVEALNMTFDNDPDDISVPTVNPVNGTRDASNTFNGSLLELGDGGTTVVALRHGDMSLSNTQFDSLVTGVDYDDLKVQNFTFSFDLSREDLQKIGSKFAFSKVIEFPATASLDISATVGVGDNQVFGVDAFLANDSNKQDLAITCNKPGVSPAAVGLKYTLKGSKLDSESFSSSIGDSKSVDMTFSTQIGGPSDTSNGIRIDNA